MRVAAEISSSVTPRISRSRFRLSPKVPVVMVLEQPGDVSEYRRAARECQSHGKVEVIAEITLGCSLRSKGTDCARVQGPGIINWQ
jgi:hypothetical protein